MTTLVRMLAWLLALLLVLLPMVAVLGGWLTPERWPLRRLAVVAEYRHVSAEQIRAVVAAQTGQGYFDTDPASIRTALAALPWVAGVEVRKRWPDRVEVSLREHRAQAHWGDDQLLSERGVLFPADPDEALPDLPYLQGPEARRDEVLAFYRQAQARLGASGQALIGASLSPRGSWSLHLADGVDIVIGREPGRRLDRLVQALPQLSGDESRVLKRIDLRYTNGFAVQWGPPSAGKVPAGQHLRGEPNSELSSRPPSLSSGTTATSGPVVSRVPFRFSNPGVKA